MKITPREKRRHVRSCFARSTIPEEKWGTTRSLCFPILTELLIRHFHVVVTQRRLINVEKKRDAQAKLMFANLNLALLLFAFLVLVDVAVGVA